jgi:hypothetical protein
MLNLRNTIEEAVYNRLRCQRKPADGAQGFYLSKKQRGISLNRLTALSHTGTSSLSSQGCSTSFRERVEILYDHYGQQVMLLDTLVSVFAEPAPEVPILDQFERVLRAGFRIIGDKPVLPIDNLRAQACGRRSDHWLEFPHGFRYRQTKTLADGTLEHGTRIALKRIHLRVLDQVRVSEQVDIGIRSLCWLLGSSVRKIGIFGIFSLI